MSTPQLLQECLSLFLLFLNPFLCPFFRTFANSYLSGPIDVGQEPKAPRIVPVDMG